MPANKKAIAGMVRSYICPVEIFRAFGKIFISFEQNIDRA